MTINDLKPGQRVRITQEIDRREGNWASTVTGVVQSAGQEQTGSWFAHSKNGKYWLWRVRLRKDDGELTTLTVDPLTRVEPA
jgi:hypothetical protein